MKDVPRRIDEPDDAQRPKPLIPEVLERDDLNGPETEQERWGEDQQPPFPWQLFEGGFQVRSVNCGPGCVAIVIVACIVLALLLNLFI
jgi:hypothetical protein